MTEYTVDMIKASDDIWGVGSVFDVEEILLSGWSEETQNERIIVFRN